MGACVIRCDVVYTRWAESSWYPATITFMSLPLSCKVPACGTVYEPSAVLTGTVNVRSAVWSLRAKKKFVFVSGLARWYVFTSEFDAVTALAGSSLVMSGTAWRKYPISFMAGVLAVSWRGSLMAAP